jgi:beta-lactamase regulating signal transducer with metallopeptidase domain
LPPAALLASAHVDAPVVLGHRAPAILLPWHAARHLDADAMAPLIAHELAHVARSDYAVNLAHSTAEALLIFSPAVHWIADRIREAREYCCDDLVVARCGPRPYADALATLAGLGATPRARPALNVVGPRLIVRIRRLLEEDAMTPVSTARLTALAVVFVLAAVAGSRIVPLSATAVAQGPALAAGSIPFAFPPQQDGANVTLRSFVPAADRVCGTAPPFRTRRTSS